MAANSMTMNLNGAKARQAPQSCIETYGAEYFCINKDNFTDFVVS